MIFWDREKGSKRLHFFKIAFFFLWPAAYLQPISSFSYTGCFVGNWWELCTTATKPLKQSSSLYNYLSLFCCRTQVKCQSVPDTIKITRFLQPFFLQRNTGFMHQKYEQPAPTSSYFLKYWAFFAYSTTTQ